MLVKNNADISWLLYYFQTSFSVHLSTNTEALTFSFTRYSNDIRTIIDRYTNVIPYTYDSDIQYDMEYDSFFYVYIQNYRDFFYEPYSVVICLNSPVRKLLY